MEVNQTSAEGRREMKQIEHFLPVISLRDDAVALTMARKVFLSTAIGSVDLRRQCRSEW